MAETITVQYEPLLILCGGLSSRMGTPKALLPFDGVSLIHKLIKQTHPNRPVWLAAAGQIYPDTGRAYYLNDALPERQGPLAAILPALQQAHWQGEAGIYVLACVCLVPDKFANRAARLPANATSRDGGGRCRHLPAG